MSMQTLERAILKGSKVFFKNPKLRMKDIVEWSSGKIKFHDGEVVARVEDPGIWVAIKTEHDKR